MKIQKSVLWVFTLVTVFVLAACTTQTPPQPTSTATTPAEVVATTAVATVESTATAEATATVEPTATLEPTATTAVEPTATTEIAATPTTIAAIAGGQVFVTLSQNTVCRTGPAKVYPSVTTVQAGQRLNAVGKLENNTSYTYVEDPSAAGTYCWVYSEGAVLEGNRAELKVVAPLPTPAPKSNMGFSITYSGINECAGGDYTFNLVVANTNDVIWRSIKVYIVDVKTMKAVSYSSDHFEGWYKCHVDNYQNDLAKGEHVWLSPFNPGHFDYRPYGGTFLVRVTLCTEDGFGGTCLTKEIKAQP